MSAVLSWAGDDDGLPAQGFVNPSRSRTRRSRPGEPQGELPPEVEQALWRGTDLGVHAGPVVSSGYADLDAQLPGGGWPCRSVSEILCPQPSVIEWRVIGPTLRRIVAGVVGSVTGGVAGGGKVVVIGPPKTPHLPGLHHCGIDEKHLVWIQAQTPSERLWSTEQLVKSGACGALVAWLPQARPEQIRRLQVCASACEGPVFLFRPAAAQHEPSAAPLRVLATCALDWEILVHVLKRRGPTHEGQVRLRSVPGGLESILTPRLQTPSRLIAAREVPGRAPTSPMVQQAPVHALGSTATPVRPRGHATVR